MCNYVPHGDKNVRFCQITRIYRESKEVGSKLVAVSDITFTYVRVSHG